MSDQQKITEKDLTNMTRSFGIPAPTQVLDMVLETLEKERIEELKQEFSRGSCDENERER